MPINHLELIRLTIRVSRQEQERLRALARTRKASVAGLARQAINDYLIGEVSEARTVPLSEAARQREHLRLMRTRLTNGKRRRPE